MNTFIRKTLTPALIYSGIFLGILILLSIVLDITGNFYSGISRYGGIIITFAGMIYAMYSFRKEYNEDLISYQKALGFGVLVAFLVGLFSSAFSYLYVYHINTDLIELGRRVAEDTLLERGMSPEMVETQMARQARFQNPGFIIGFGTLFTTLLGTIIALIAAAAIKKEPKDPFQGVQ